MGMGKSTIRTATRGESEASHMAHSANPGDMPGGNQGQRKSIIAAMLGGRKDLDKMIDSTAGVLKGGGGDLGRMRILMRQVELQRKLDRENAAVAAEEAKVEDLKQESEERMKRLADLFSLDPEEDDCFSDGEETDGGHDGEWSDDDIEEVVAFSSELEQSSSMKGDPSNEPVHETKVWTKVVDTMMHAMDKNDDGVYEDPTFERSATNIFSLVCMFFEWYTYCSLALKLGVLRRPYYNPYAFAFNTTDTPPLPNVTFTTTEEYVQWVADAPLFDLSDLSDSKSWEGKELFPWSFSFALVVALCLPYFIKRGVKEAKAGILGLDVVGSKAKLLSYEGRYVRVLTVLGSQLYLVVLKHLMSAFACDYNTHGHSYRLRAQPSVACFEPSSDWRHPLYMAGATVGIMAYYPVATLMVPNLLFQDKSCDVKFNPVFVILALQGTVLLNVFALFLAPYPIAAQVCAMLVFLLLGHLCEEMRPCDSFKKLNIWKAATYWCPAAICFGGIVVEVDSWRTGISVDRERGYILVGAGLGLVLVRAKYLSLFSGRRGLLQQVFAAFVNVCKKKTKVAPVTLPGLSNTDTFKWSGEQQKKNSLETLSNNRRTSVDVEQIYRDGDVAMVALEGTEQGDSGWYYEPRPDGRAAPMFYEVDKGGEWVRHPEIKGAPVKVASKKNIMPPARSSHAPSSLSKKHLSAVQFNI